VSAQLPTEYLMEPYTLGRGIRELVKGDTPAAGADFSLTMEGRYITRLLSVHVRLVSDATVANREVVLEYRNDANLRYELAGAPVTWPASSTVDYEFNIHQGQAEWVVDSSVLVPLPRTFLPEGFNLRIHVVNIQATDALSAIRIYWERYWTDQAH